MAAPVSRRRSKAPRPKRRRKWVPRLSVGRVLSDGLGVYLRNFVAFSMVTIVIFGVLIVLQVVQLKGALAGEGVGNTLTFVRIPLSLGLPFVLSGALAYGVFQELRQRRATIGDCIGVGLRRLLPVLGVALILVVMLGVVFGMAGGAFGVFFSLDADTGIVLLLVILSIAASVVAAALMCVFYVAVPAAVVEEVGPMQALARSKSLTQGSRWAIFGILFVLFMLEQLALFLLRMFLPPDVIVSMGGLFLTLPLVIVFGAWKATCSTTAYYYLRQEKEGVGIDDLAAVFD